MNSSKLPRHISNIRLLLSWDKLWPARRGSRSLGRRWELELIKRQGRVWTSVKTLRWRGSQSRRPGTTPGGRVAALMTLIAWVLHLSIRMSSPLQAGRPGEATGTHRGTRECSVLEEWSRTRQRKTPPITMPWVYWSFSCYWTAMLLICWARSMVHSRRAQVKTYCFKVRW